MNPYTLPNRPRVTIREILAWVVKVESVTSADVSEHFEISANDAAVRLNKMWKWGYIKRRKRELPPRRLEYTVSRFGRKTVSRWKRK